MFCCTRFKDEFSCRVLYLLKWFEVDNLPVGNCYSLIWTGCMRLGCIFGEILANGTYVSDFSICSLTRRRRRRVRRRGRRRRAKGGGRGGGGGGEEEEEEDVDDEELNQMKSIFIFNNNSGDFYGARSLAKSKAQCAVQKDEEKV